MPAWLQAAPGWEYGLFVLPSAPVPSNETSVAEPAPVKKPLPYATEEEWSLRIEKRWQGLNDVENSDAFRMNQDVPDKPQRPDPTDKELSKRDWERVIASYRTFWRRAPNARELVKMGLRMSDAQMALSESKEDFSDALRILCVQQLMAMGFERKYARGALKRANDNMAMAVQILASQ